MPTDEEIAKEQLAQRRFNVGCEILSSVGLFALIIGAYFGIRFVASFWQVDFSFDTFLKVAGIIAVLYIISLLEDIRAEVSRRPR